MKRPGRWLAAVVAAQALFLLGWAGYHEWVRQSATIILVEARPVDPRDVLRGDYLTIAYAIGTVALPEDAAPAAAGHRVGDELWVVLRPAGVHHVVARTAWQRPRVTPGEVLLRGTCSYNEPGPGQRVRVLYGIEKYFVPEGRGSPRFQRMEVELAVSPTHRPYIRRVLLDGRAFP